MLKEKLVCSVCGSDNFVRDAWAKWNVEEQQFELHSSYDDGKCLNEECEADGRGEWIEVEEPEGIAHDGERS